MEKKKPAKKPKTKSYGYISMTVNGVQVTYEGTAEEAIAKIGDALSEAFKPKEPQ